MTLLQLILIAPLIWLIHLVLLGKNVFNIKDEDSDDKVWATVIVSTILTLATVALLLPVIK